MSSPYWNVDGQQAFVTRGQHRRYGFIDCRPFGNYAVLPPHTIATSVFLDKPIAGGV